MPKHEWRCPKCGREIVLFVNTAYPPVCYNTNKHSASPTQMHKVEDEHARGI